MNRIQNHKEGGIASVYDRHEYADENKRVMEAVAAQHHGAGRGADGAERGAVYALKIVAGLDFQGYKIKS